MARSVLKIKGCIAKEIRQLLKKDERYSGNSRTFI